MRTTRQTWQYWGRVWLRRLAWCAAGAAAAALVLSGGLAIYLYASFHLSPQAAPPPGRQTAVWLAHTWAGQPHTPAAYQQMFAQLAADRVDFVYAHVGPLTPGGTIPVQRYRAAGELLAAAHRLDPSLRVLAWVGQLIQPHGPLNLDSPVVRARIVATASRLLDLGFAGIHYDLEPVPSGDRSFLQLLAATRAMTRPRHRLLSLSAPPLEPTPIGGLLSTVLPSYTTWSASYYRQVGAQTGQVAVMTYGTAFPSSWAYGSFVRWETHHLAPLMHPPTTLLIGLPTYDVAGWGVFHHAETLAAGLRGVREGLAGACLNAPVGVAVYAGWTTTRGDWRMLRSSWSGVNPAAGVGGPADLRRTGGPLFGDGVTAVHDQALPCDVGRAGAGQPGDGGGKPAAGRGSPGAAR